MALLDPVLIEAVTEYTTERQQSTGLAATNNETLRSRRFRRKRFRGMVAWATTLDYKSIRKGVEDRRGFTLGRACEVSLRRTGIYHRGAGMRNKAIARREREDEVNKDTQRINDYAGVITIEDLGDL